MTNYWMCRPTPSGEDRTEEFLSKNLIAIGWGKLGDLTGKTREGIKGLLSQEGYQSYELGRAYGTVDLFVNQMTVGDLVLVPDGETVHLCRITGDYAFEVAALADDYPHQRSVIWLRSIERTSLPLAVRNSLKARAVAANLANHARAIEVLASGEQNPPQDREERLLTVKYPLRSSEEISITVPADMTQEEAERLGNLVKTLYFK